MLRSAAAASRRATRAQARRQRANAKEQEREHAKLQAQAYESRIEVLRSVHADCSTPVDWSQLMWASPPPEPVLDDSRVRAAQAELGAYQPGFIERTFGGAKTKRAQLEAVVAGEESLARERHANAMARWEQAVALLRWQQRVGGGVLSGDVEAYRAVIEYWDVFDELEELGSAVEVASLSSREAEIDLYVNDDEVIPSQVYSLLASGKLSIKSMPVGQRNLLYQDYVCGSALRIARELFAVLSIQRVLVHVVADLLDTSTGQVEAQPVLSIVFPRETFARLNFSALDASDAMKHFLHRMKVRPRRRPS